MNKKRLIVILCCIFLCFLPGCSSDRETEDVVVYDSFYYKSISNYSVLKNGFIKKESAIDLYNPNNSTYFDPSVVFLEDLGIFRMYISDRANKRIISFDSIDGVEWTNFSINLENDPSIEWEQNLNRASVIKIKSKYYMYYTGQAEGKSYIGVAVSDDALHFKKMFNDPIISPELEWENLSVMNPYVMYNSALGKYVMYYAAGETSEPNVIAYAISDDGISFIKKGVIVEHRSQEYVDCDRVGGCEVYYINRQFLMLYIGYSEISVGRVCYATSKDGIKWNRLKDNVLISPSQGGFDENACYKPTLLQYNGSNKIFYNGRRYSLELIGMAEIDDEGFEKMLS